MSVLDLDQTTLPTLRYDSISASDPKFATQSGTPFIRQFWQHFNSYF